VSPPQGLADLAARLVAGVPDGLPDGPSDGVPGLPGLLGGLPAGATPPAGVALALRAPGVAQSAAAGLRSVPTGGAEAAPLTVDTHHDLASVTKIVATTTALIRLVSEGIVGLDDEARRYVPGFFEGDKASITVRQLLLHRAGLREWFPLYLAADDASSARDHLDRLPLRYQPDTGRHYSDLGFILLGRIIAMVTGQRLEDAVSTLVTGPLGMSSTRFAHPAVDPADRAADVATSSFGDQCEMAMVDTGIPYPVPFRSADFASWRRVPITGEVGDGNAFHAFAGVSGHAGLFSTLSDLVTFADAFANYAEHEELWDPRVAQEFFAPGPDAIQALGFRRYRLDLGHERVDLLGHPGFVGCAVGFVPGRGIALAMASNRLLTSGSPVPTEHLWQQALAEASTAIAEQAA